MQQLLGLGPVADAARYHLATGGRRIRAGIAQAAGAALDIDADAVLASAVAVELLHNASLIHDDLQDGDRSRRHQPTVWACFGEKSAILAGDLMISAAYAALARHPHPAAALVVTHDAVATTIRGQADDLATSEASAAQARFDEYLHIATTKSGPLLALPMRLVLLAAGISGDAEAARAGNFLASAYQLLDDLADREQDRERGVLNGCFILEGEGRSKDEAAALALSHARRSLTLACAAAKNLPAGVGQVYLALADRLLAPFPEAVHVR